jgi:hypothetical protein
MSSVAKYLAVAISNDAVTVTNLENNTITSARSCSPAEFAFDRTRFIVTHQGNE